MVVAASRLWEPGDKLSRVLGQRRDTPANEKWSGRWESNPRLKLGKLGYYHYTTPAPLPDSSRLSEDQATTTNRERGYRSPGAPRLKLLQRQRRQRRRPRRLTRSARL